jgi:hypothetical protein
VSKGLFDNEKENIEVWHKICGYLTSIEIKVESQFETKIQKEESSEPKAEAEVSAFAEPEA